MRNFPVAGVAGVAGSGGLPGYRLGGFLRGNIRVLPVTAQPVQDLFTMNGNIPWGIDPQTDLSPLYSEDGDGNVITDH